MFLKLKKYEHPSYLFYIILKAYQHKLPETITTSLYLVLNTNISETLFFHSLLWSGVSSIIILEIRNRFALFKNKSLTLTDQALRVCLMCMTRTE